MNTQDFKRKLTAVFSADVAGYSRLMGEDEAATVTILEAYKQVMFSLIKQHRGRVIDSPGDNLLAEFASVVDAVQCGVAVQKELQARNADLPENRKMRFRIGINLGDVIEEGERIYGDGVNVAARIEGLALPGGVCVSGTAYDHVENKVAVEFEYLGEQAVKNIRKPVRAYRIKMDRGAPDVSMRQEITLPDKPSIAVLPFLNMSDDPKQEYFCDGITEEIITGLSKISGLLVIARNSSFTYKGRSVRVQEVGKDLGVKYVLEGSVRKAGDRVRITAQLIDTSTGHHLWSERYDRELKEIFLIQDEITTEVMRMMQVKLMEGEQACAWLKRGSGNLEAYEKGMKGMEYFRRFSPEGNVQSRKMFEEGIVLDPETPGNYVMLGWTHLVDILQGSTNAPDRSMEQAADLARKALDLDESQADAHALLGYVHLLKRDYDRAIAEGERAVSLNPNYADAHAWLAMILASAGKPNEGIVMIKKAMRLNPRSPNWYFTTLGDAYLWAQRYNDALGEYSNAVQNSPGYLLAYLGLTATYSLLGNEKEATETATKVLSIDPKFSLDRYEENLSNKEQADKDRYISALRKAGLK
jgi:adenylate cyclase